MPAIATTVHAFPGPSSREPVQPRAGVENVWLREKRSASEPSEPVHEANPVCDIPTRIESQSGNSTLLPRTVIRADIPQGVGAAMTRAVSLQPGDEATQMNIGMQKIGALRNPVGDET